MKKPKKTPLELSYKQFDCDEDIKETVATARICTVEEMTVYAGAPCKQYAVGCFACEAWAKWRMTLEMLHEQRKMQAEMRRWKEEDQ